MEPRYTEGCFLLNILGFSVIKIPKQEYDKVVVGGNLRALQYSDENNIPIVINKIDLPNYFEKINNVPAVNIWQNLFYSLSLAGLNLVGNKAANIRIRGESVSVSTAGARTIKLKCSEIIVFDDEKVSGLPAPEKENEDFVVLDWMIARSCESHLYNVIETEDLFVNKVYFYPSERGDGNHPNRKDLVSVSFLKKEQLNDFEYSDTYARFKVAHLLKEKGLRGIKCGGSNHYALKLEVDRREIKKAHMHLYKSTERIKFK